MVFLTRQSSGLSTIVKVFDGGSHGLPRCSSTNSAINGTRNNEIAQGSSGSLGAKHCARTIAHGFSAWARTTIRSHPILVRISPHHFAENSFAPRPALSIRLIISDGKFSEFADAQSLKMFNAEFVSRDREEAKPGDLLFFHQPWVQKFPFHVMIFIGEPRVASEGAHDWVVYHTGASPDDEGTVKKVRLSVLDGHPEKRWRPVQTNPNFLGFYRLKILNQQLITDPVRVNDGRNERVPPTAIDSPARGLDLRCRDRRGYLDRRLTSGSRNTGAASGTRNNQSATSRSSPCHQTALSAALRMLDSGWTIVD